MKALATVTKHLTQWILSYINRRNKKNLYELCKIIQLSTAAKTVLGKTKCLNENEDINQKHQTGGESNLSCYLLLYLYFQNCVKVGRWEREESSWLLSQSGHMFVIFRCRSIFRWKVSERVHMLPLNSHAPLTLKVTRLGRGRDFQASLEALHPSGLFLLCM